jgi:hypothetical protein
MLRMQVQFTEKQANTLKRMAADTGRSIADLVRDCVDSRFANAAGHERPALVDRAKRASGRFSSGLRDVSRNHDKYLAEDFAR